MSLSDTDLISTYFQTFYARYSHKCRLPPGELHSLLKVRLGDLWHQVLLVIHVHGGGALTGARTVKYQLQLFQVQGTDIVLLGSFRGVVQHFSLLSKHKSQHTLAVPNKRSHGNKSAQITPVALEAHLEVVSFEAGFLAANSFYNTRCI